MFIISYRKMKQCFKYFLSKKIGYFGKYDNSAYGEAPLNISNDIASSYGELLCYKEVQKAQKHNFEGKRKVNKTNTNFLISNTKTVQKQMPQTFPVLFLCPKILFFNFLIKEKVTREGSSRIVA